MQKCVLSIVLLFLSTPFTLVKSEETTTTNTTEDDTFDAGAVVIVPPDEEDYNFTALLRPLQQAVHLFNDKDGGLNEALTLDSGKCTPIPESWIGRVGSLKHDGFCIRLWQTNKCGGYTRCYCVRGFLPLDNSFCMSNELSWYRNVNGLSMCYVENETFSRILLFSERNYQGADKDGSAILAPDECLTFYKGDKWRNRIKSLIVTDGCVEYFNEEHCTGKGVMLDVAENVLAEPYDENIKSLRNCVSYMDLINEGNETSILF